MGIEKNEGLIREILEGNQPSPKKKGRLFNIKTHKVSNTGKGIAIGTLNGNVFNYGDPSISSDDDEEWRRVLLHG